MRSVLVEAQTSGKTYEVDLTAGTCTCSAQDQPCFHVLKARDIHTEGCRRSRFEIVSALHKEMRRGDVEAALYWADILSRYSESYVENYARRIVGEETRNWVLFGKALSHGATGYRELVAAVASSRKKWEHRNGRRLFEEQMRSYNRDTYEGRTWPEVVIAMASAIGASDVPRLYDAWAALDEKNEPDAIEAMDHVLVAETARRFPIVTGQAEIVEAYRGHVNLDAWEIRLTLVEMIAGAWDVSMNEFPHGPTRVSEIADGRVIRRFPPYVYDRHVRQGAWRIAEYRNDIAPMKRLPEGIDLRWSGQIEGVAWRYAAFAQFGDGYRDRAWEDVEMTADYLS